MGEYDEKYVRELEELVEEQGAQLEAMAAKTNADKHRKAFDNAAKKAGVKPDMLDDAWKLSEVDTKGEPDEKALGAGLKDFLERRPHYKAEQAESDQEGEEKPAGGEKIPKGEGTSRGKAMKGPAGKFVVDRRDLSSMEWMQKNQSAYAAAVKADNVHYVGPPT